MIETDPQRTHSEERKLAEAHLSEVVMDTDEDEKMRLELLDLFRQFADATDASIEALIVQHTYDEARIFAALAAIANVRTWTMPQDAMHTVFRALGDIEEALQPKAGDS